MASINDISRQTISSRGSSADGGSLSSAKYGTVGTSNGTTDRAIFSGGGPSGSGSTDIQFMTVLTFMRIAITEVRAPMEQAIRLLFAVTILRYSGLTR